MDSTEASALLGGGAGAADLARSCLSERLHPDSFAGRPVVSILLNYFKRPQVVSRISANIRASCAAVGMPCELVVNVDNPQEAYAWAAEAAAEGAPGFVVPVFSANLHEARGYNRAARLARGRYLVVWQDDQVPPMDGQWLVDMIKLFDTYPQLGILGMNTYRLCKHHEPTNRWGHSLWEPDPKTGVRWTYAQTVDFAPLAVRASIYRAIGGLDEGTARRGDCGIWGDWELCLRAWMDGWQVGFMHLDGRSGDGEPGTTHKGANGEKCWGRQQHVAMNMFHQRYGAEWLQNPLCDRVWLLNMLTFELADRCPYGSYETRYANCTKPPEDVAATARAEFATLAAAAVARGIGTGASSVMEEPARGPGAAGGAGGGSGGANPAPYLSLVGALSGAQGGSQSVAAAVDAAVDAAAAEAMQINPMIVRGGGRRMRRLR